MGRKKKVKRKIDELSKTNKEFVLNYIELGRNGTKAYLKTFKNENYGSARVLSTRLLAKVNIKEALQEYYNDLFKNKEDKISILFENLIDCANVDISDFIDENGNIKVKEFDELNTYAIAQYDKTVTDTAQGRNVKQSIKVMDKLKAIGDLIKILNMITEKVKVEVNYNKENIIEIQNLFDEQIISEEDNK